MVERMPLTCEKRVKECLATILRAIKISGSIAKMVDTFCDLPLFCNSWTEGRGRRINYGLELGLWRLSG